MVGSITPLAGSISLLSSANATKHSDHTTG